MSESTEDRGGRAERVVEEWLRRRLDGKGEPKDEFLHAHADLRDAIEPLLVEQERISHILHDSAPSAPRPTPRVLGDFRVVREIGRGGMGLVYEAEQISLSRRVALKVLPAYLTLDERALRRFQREASITARLQHKSIIDIHAVGEADGAHYIAMELLHGTSLDRLIERIRGESFETLRSKKLDEIVSLHARSAGESTSASRRDSSPKERTPSSAWNKGYIESAVRIIVQVAEALEYAHHAGVIHRDVKPSNIFVREDGTAVLTDFGIAREEGFPSITQTGEFAGTPYYVSPEQAMAKRVRVDHRTDVFSLGGTLYELLTLQRPFDGKDSHEILARILTKEPPDPRTLNPALATDLVTITLKALEKDPDRRYQRAEDLAADLRAFIEYRPIRARRTARITRALRWVKRDPIKAALLGVLVVGVPAMSGLLVKLLDQQETIAGIERVARVEKALELGYVFIVEGRPQDAVDAFRRALVDEPSSTEALGGIALFGLYQNEPLEGLRILGDGGNPPILSRLRADLLEAAGKTSEAQDLRAGFEPPRDPFEHFLEGHRALRAFPDDPEAAARAWDHFNQAAVMRPRAIYVFGMAQAAFLENDSIKKKRAAEALDHLDPKSAMILFYVGRLRDGDAAIAAYREALELDPDFAWVHTNLGKILWEQDNRDEADLHFAKAYDLAPKSWETCYHRARALVAAGRPGDAVPIARSIVDELAPTLPDGYRLLGEAHEQMGQFAEADAVYQKWTQVQPDDHRAWNQLAWLHSNEAVPADFRDVKRALEAAAKAVERADAAGARDAYLCLDTAAWANYHNGDLEKAVSLGQRAWDVANASGANLEELAAIKESLNTFMRALEQSHTSPAVLPAAED